MINFDLIRQINIEGLKRNDLGNSLNFVAINDTLKSIYDFFLFFQNKPFNLTKNINDAILGYSTAFVALCNRIQAFEHPGSQTLQAITQQHEKLIGEIKAFEKQFIPFILPIINNLEIHDETKLKKGEEIISRLTSYEAQWENKLKNLESQSQERIKNLDNSIQQSISSAGININKSNELLEKTENFSLGKLVEKYGGIFENQAKIHKKIAIVSFVVFIISTTILIIVVSRLFLPLIEQVKDINYINAGLEYLIAALIFRLTLIAIFSVVVFESLKNYNVNMHLYNMNKHRQNSLLSFDTFISNTHDSVTRNSLIGEIAKTIYSQGQTGYLPEDKKGLSLSKVIELFKAMKQ